MQSPPSLENWILICQLILSILILISSVKSSYSLIILSLILCFVTVWELQMFHCVAFFVLVR